ncbi:nucleotide exchange factor GrpE [Mucilaginibacter sp.]|uniref:nucleotide exchange factor GrpE n=1 Tax=Mucilaginibacter sp. TaxID=1882438 RepID=UPI003AFFDF01
MNFNDILKKMKKEEPTSTEKNTNMDEIFDEFQQVNEARQNQKNETEGSDNENVDTEFSAEDKHKEELALANDKFLRLYAEFDNYKRRTSKERVELLQTAGKDVIVSLLPVLDDFERASRAIENAKDVSAVKEGVSLVHNKLKNLLSQKGLKEMLSKGQPFDADIHEAVTNIPAPSDDLKGKVVDVLEEGYLLNDKVIRFAKVVVGA